LDEVEVIGQKSTVLLDDLPRIVEIIDASSIQSSPGQSFQDKIQYQSNIDISQRGQFGIQSDVSIRGGSFDQVLILQNGINLTDPQTGHHNLNIPIDPEVIYKIEILNGPAARAIGANAYSGAINIITKPRFKNQLSLSANTGAFGYMRSHIGTNLASKNTKHLLSGSYSRSDGYINNSDFEVFNFHYHGDF
jgi:vitamin B12 transporter